MDEKAYLPLYFQVFSLKRREIRFEKYTSFLMIIMTQISILLGLNEWFLSGEG